MLLSFFLHGSAADDSICAGVVPRVHIDSIVDAEVPNLLGEVVRRRPSFPLDHRISINSIARFRWSVGHKTPSETRQARPGYFLGRAGRGLRKLDAENSRAEPGPTRPSCCENRARARQGPISLAPSFVNSHFL